jgi:two-component system response regulator FlrC
MPMIRDLASRNGVFVNGSKVSQAGLNPQDVIRLGDWVGVVVPFEAWVDSTFRSITPGWYGSNKLFEAVEPARRVAETDLPVTIEGETGTGKEGLARAIHAWSGRNGNFVAVNCATIQPELAEATLFGHRKGAFTGADRAAVGYFRAAAGGTLLLDEIVELPLAVQAKLLRALEEKEVVPVGETDPVKVDVRVVAATQESLRNAARERGFRADLMARLEGLTITLPPLRDRREDVAPLLLTFLREMTGGNSPKVDSRLIEQILLYDWPLNVRELAHLARQLLALHSAAPTLRRSLLPARIRGAGKLPDEPGPAPTRTATQDEQAFEKLVAALRANSGNIARAAAALSISRARAYRLLDARPDFEVAALRPEGERK